MNIYWARTRTHLQLLRDPAALRVQPCALSLCRRCTLRRISARPLPLLLLLLGEARLWLLLLLLRLGLPERLQKEPQLLMGPGNAE